MFESHSPVRLMRAALLLLLFASGHAYGQGARETLRYGDAERHQLDLYLPDGVENPPLLVFIHGGRWFRNDKSQIELYGRVDALMDAGIALASLNYRYSTEAKWPAQIEDVEKAIGFLRDRADDFGFDGTRIAVWGQSSGAHMALWAGLLSANAPDSMVRAIVSWYAPSDLFSLVEDRAADQVPDGRPQRGEAPESLLIGQSVPENKDAADAASPAIYASQLPSGMALPAILLMHGTMDPVVSPLQSERLYSILKKQGGAADLQLIEVDGGGHGGELFTPHVKTVIAFLQEAFGN